jgi:methyltransferase (TIGR00027 family)
MYVCMGPLIIARKLFGFTTTLSRNVPPAEAKMISFTSGRNLVFDQIMKKNLDKVDQIVIPGAGFDLRDLLFTKEKSVKVFELDQVNTQKLKVETLKKAGISHDWITYIPVDYAKESWVDKLLATGFDKSKKTLFLWESVSLYLDEDTVRDSLIKMADLSAPGSIIAQDVYSKALLTGEISKTIAKSVKMYEKYGESWIFGIDMSGGAKAAVESFLKECGLRLTEFTQFGEKIGATPYYCICEAVKQ